MDAVRIITLIVLLLLPNTLCADIEIYVGDGDPITSKSDDSASCGCCAYKICRPVEAEKKVDERYWICEEVEFCVPCPRLWPGDCDSRRAVLRTRKKLKREKVERIERGLNWEIETSSPHCSTCAERSQQQDNGPQSELWLSRVLRFLSPF